MAYYFRLPMITDLTEDQQMALDEINPIAISGGAGTGKTVVSLYRHIQLMEDLGKYSVLLTYTKTLRFYLEMTIRSIENKQRYENTKILPPSQQVFNLKTFPKGQWSVYEIIIDEAQDLNYQTLISIRNYAKQVSYGADFNQQLYKGTVKEKEIQNLFSQNIRYNLQQNFRNTYSILNFAKSILPNLLISQSMLDELEYEKKGIKPKLFITNNNREREIDKLIELIKLYESDNIAILLPFGDDTFSNSQFIYDSVEHYYNQLISKNIKCSKYYNEMKTDNIIIEKIHVTTYKSVKGLEFDTVIIPCMENFQNYIIKDDFPLIVNEEDYYVAFTRAKDNLFLFSSNELNFINSSICEIEILNNSHYNKISVPEIDRDEDEIPF